MKKKIISTLFIFMIVFSSFIMFGNKNTEASSDVYDIILFWGQSNMAGFSNTEGQMPSGFDDLYNFSKDSDIADDILARTKSTSQVNTPIQDETAYFYKYTNNSFEKITSNTYILGDGFEASEYKDGKKHGLMYNASTGKLDKYVEGTSPYVSIQTTENVNMIPEFCRTYYAKTGHKVIAVAGAVGGTSIECFLPHNHANHKIESGADYMYEAIKENFKGAVNLATSKNYTIGGKYWVSFQGENNVGDVTESSSTPNKVNYEKYFTEVKNNLKNDLGITRGAIVETSNLIGWDWPSIGVKQIHTSQENLIKNNNDIILGSSYAYDHYIPDEATYYSNTFITKKFLDEAGNKLNYQVALEQAKKSVCFEQNNGIHFHSATLSQIGRDCANNLANAEGHSKVFDNLQQIDYNSIPDSQAYFNNLTLPQSSSVSAGDPFLIKEGSTYYLYATDNVYYTSSNLKDWTYKGNWVPANDPDKGKNSYYFWAPEVYKHNGKFYLLYTKVYWGNGYPYGNGSSNTSQGAVYLAETNNLANGFSYVKKIEVGLENVLTKHDANYSYIDGSFLFEGSSVYMYFKSEESQDIYVIELDSNFNKKTAGPTRLFGLNTGVWERNINEGPFVFKKNNTYYLMYSSGQYKNDSYAVGYATASSPMGPFTKQTASAPLLYGETPKFENNHYVFDSNQYIYGSGHNMILKISEDEMYTVYHSATFNKNNFETSSDEKYQGQSVSQYTGRKLNLDRIGVASNGKLFVNGPSTVNQPLPSETSFNGKTYDQLSGNAYSILTDNNSGVSYLTDTVDCFNKNVNAQLVKTVNMQINLNTNKNPTDIWLYGNGSALGFNSATVDISINDTYAMKNISLGNSNCVKLKMPTDVGKINTIKIVANKELSLSEVKVVVSDTPIVESVSMTFNETTKEVTIKSTTSVIGTLQQSKFREFVTQIGADKIQTITFANPVNLSATSSAQLFRSLPNLVTINNISNLNVSSVTDLNYMFLDCNNLRALDLSSWNVSNVTNMSHMFQGCSNLSSLNVGTWNTSNVTDMEYMFIGCSKLASINFENWNTAKVTTMLGMFQGCDSLTFLKMSKWNMRNVTDVRNMLHGCTSLTEIYTPSAFSEQTVTLPTSEWYNVNNVNDNTVYANFKNGTFTGSVYLKKLANYEIAYNLNGGAVTGNPETYNAVSNFSLKNPTRNGHTFTGWTGSNGNTKQTNVSINGRSTTGNLNFTANWEANTVPTKAYKVEHWQQNINGDANSHDANNYTLKETDNLSDEVGIKVTPARKTYTGFTAPNGQEITIAESGEIVVRYYYIRNRYTVALNKTEGIASITGAGNYLYGESVTISATIADDYVWSAWVGQAETIKQQEYTFVMGAGNVTYTAYAGKIGTPPVAQKDYKVEHWQQRVVGDANKHDEENYLLNDTENLTAPSGTTLTPDRKNYTGFTAPAGQSVKIEGSGEIVIKYYYTRNRYTVTLNKTEGIESVTGAGDYLYGALVSTNATVANGYTWLKWTGYSETTKQDHTFAMPAHDVIYTANATKTETPVINKSYKVEHWQQNINGNPNTHNESNYTLKDTDNLSAEVGTKVTPNRNTYTGFTAPNAQEITIPETGEIVVKYYYTRNRYTVNLEKDEGIESVSGANDYYYGQDVEIRAVVKENYLWVNWTGYETQKDTKVNFTMPTRNVTFKANSIKKASVTTKYVDMNGGKELLEAVVENGYEGKDYKTEEKSIDGYQTVRVEGIPEGKMSGDRVVTYVMAKTTKIEISYFNQANNKSIADTKSVSGYVGKEYDVKPMQIKGYQYVACSDNTSGAMTEEVIKVSFYYLKETGVNVKYVDMNTNEEIAEAKHHDCLASEKYDVTKDYQDIDNYIFIKDSGNTKGTMTEKEIDVIYYYAYRSSITVKYYDIFTNQEITDADVIDGYEGKEYDIEKKEIKGYQFTKTKDDKGEMKREKTELQMYYTKETSIEIQSLDYDTKKPIQDSQIINGIEGQEYDVDEIKELDGYVLYKKATNTKGKMGPEKIEIVNYYARKGKVILRYMDIDTKKEIQNKKEYECVSGDIYQVKEGIVRIEGYNFVNTSKDLEGKMTNEDITIEVYYRKNTEKPNDNNEKDKNNNSNQNQNQNENKNQNKPVENNNQKNDTKNSSKDDTLFKGVIPKTGMKTILIPSIIAMIVISFKKYRKYKKYSGIDKQ